jgi:aryl-alcohol dehydrogenase-like predicted oxidoreductase
MSTKTVAGGLLAVEKTDVVMVTFNPDAQEDAAVIGHAHALHKGVLIKKALNSGHAATPHDGAREADPVQRNLDFIFARPGISAVIIGSITPAHLRHNIEAALRATAPF